MYEKGLVTPAKVPSRDQFDSGFCETSRHFNSPFHDYLKELRERAVSGDSTPRQFKISEPADVKKQLFGSVEHADGLSTPDSLPPRERCDSGFFGSPRHRVFTPSGHFNESVVSTDSNMCLEARNEDKTPNMLHSTMEPFDKSLMRSIGPNLNPYRGMPKFRQEEQVPNSVDFYLSILRSERLRSLQLQENIVKCLHKESDKSSKYQKPFAYLLEEECRMQKQVACLKQVAERKAFILERLHKRNFLNLVNLVLSFLPDEDLHAASCVSRSWRNMVLDDVDAKKRRATFLECKREEAFGENKENRHKSAGESRGVLTLFLDVTNKSPCEQPLENKTSQARYESFLELRRGLGKNEVLLKCPECKFASSMKSDVKYCCSRALCGYEFCGKCQSPYFMGHSCSSKGKEVDTLLLNIGSGKSKKNLRRL